jgi:hypothetical protein
MKPKINPKSLKKGIKQEMHDHFSSTKLKALNKAKTPKAKATVIAKQELKENPKFYDKKRKTK